MDDFLTGGAADFILPSKSIVKHSQIRRVLIEYSFVDPAMSLGGFSLPGASATALGPAALRLTGQGCASGSVLLVSNLNEEVLCHSYSTLSLTVCKDSFQAVAG